MALQNLFANNAFTNVSSGGTTAPAALTSETWTVLSSALFPAAVTGVSQFHIVDPLLPSEVMSVTNVSGTTWTVTRGAEGTPVAHSAGFQVYQVASAGDLTALATSASPALTGTPTTPTAALGDASTQIASDAFVAAAAAAAYYGPARSESYATWSLDPLSAYLTNASASLLLAWPAGRLAFTRIPVPFALSGLNGYLTCSWRAISGGSPANSYLGLFTLSGGTLTQQWGSSDQTATGTAILRLSTGITSFAADTYSGGSPSTALYAACLIGTQGTTGGGPAISDSPTQIGIYTRSGQKGRALYSSATGASALVSSVALSSLVGNNYSSGWFAID